MMKISIFKNHCGDLITLPNVNFWVPIDRYKCDLSKSIKKFEGNGLNLNIFSFFETNPEPRFVSRKSGQSYYRRP